MEEGYTIKMVSWKPLTLKDIMPGDWFYNKDNILFKVETIDGHLYEVEGTTIEGTTEKCKIDDVRPIPMWTGLLEKNGFSYEYHKYYDIYWIADKTYYFSIRNEGEYFYEYKTDKEIKFVHELQHWYNILEVTKEFKLYKPKEE